MAMSFQDPMLMPPSIKKIFPCGGWCTWMHGYWNRINEDSSTVEDEEIYELLIPMSLLEGRDGHIAAYRYNKSLWQQRIE